VPEFDRQVIARSTTNLVAFSGGPDSVCLLHVLIGMRDRGPVHAVHIDHRLDRHSAERARRAVRIARDLGVECELRSIEPNRHSGDGGPEAAARRARYACLQSMLASGDHVLTAHHADDQVETVMLRLLRGAGPAGLAGMQPMRRLKPGWLARPLLAWTRADIDAYLACHGLEYQHDPTNRDLALDRNYIRHALLPRVERRWPGYRSALLQAARWQRAAARALANDAAAALEACSRLGGRSGERLLHLGDWLDLGPEASFAVIRAWCGAAGIASPALEPLRTFRRQCHTAAADRQPELAWPAGCLHAWRGRLWLDVKPHPPLDWLEPWPAGDCCPVPAGGELCLDGRHRITPGGAWSLSATRPGMKLRVHAGRPRCQVTELMRTAGVPPWRRGRYPALHLDGRLCAIGTDWLDADFATLMRRHDCMLRWHRRPASLVP